MEILTTSWVLPVAGPSAARRDVWRSRAGGWPGWAGPETRVSPRGACATWGRASCCPAWSTLTATSSCRTSPGACRETAGSCPGSRAWWRAAGGFAEEEVRAATAEAIRFLEARGTVAVGDVSNALGHLDLLSASSLSAVVFLELLSWDPAKADAALAFAEQRRAEVAGVLRPGLEVRLAAHAPHSVSPALFGLLVRSGGPSALHLAESPDETAFLADGSGAWPGLPRATRARPRRVRAAGLEPRALRRPPRRH